MSHYEERLEKDLTRIREHLTALGSQVEVAIKNAVHALLTGNAKLAYATVLDDHPINRASRALDKLCHGFIALHLPSAGHLRIISATIRANIALERMGDYAVTICREAVQLSKPPTDTLAREVELMADESRRMLKQTMEAFEEGNADKAKATMGMADQVERTFDTVFGDLVTEGDHLRLKELFAYLVIFNMLERVSDQAKNICEETVFAATGETKAAKVYKVLFLDEDNASLGPMAVALARKTFPESGAYDSAGRQAAAALDETLSSVMAERGIGLEGVEPRTLDLSPQELADYHVIVSLQGGVNSYVSPVPFHTTALEWDVGAPPAGGDTAQVTQRYEEIHRELAVQIRDLMTALRGEGAS